jgi:hypothetical protein
MIILCIFIYCSVLVDAIFRLLRDDMYFNEGYIDRKQVDGLSLTTRSIMKSRRAHKGTAIAG